jgi:hypothetical protein
MRPRKSGDFFVWKIHEMSDEFLGRNVIASFKQQSFLILQYEKIACIFVAPCLQQRYWTGH